jgi:cold shock CspA family protein
MSMVSVTIAKRYEISMEHQTITETMSGTVIRVLHDKGYGFLRGTDGISRFFEAREVFPSIAFDRMQSGQSVQFIPAHGQKGNGQRAIHVEPIS